MISYPAYDVSRVQDKERAMEYSTRDCERCMAAEMGDDSERIKPRRALIPS